MNESCHIPGSLVIICREIPEFYAVSATQGFSDGLPCARVSAPLCWCWSFSPALLSEVLDCCLVCCGIWMPLRNQWCKRFPPHTPRNFWLVSCGGVRTQIWVEEGWACQQESVFEDMQSDFRLSYSPLEGSCKTSHLPAHKVCLIAGEAWTHWECAAQNLSCKSKIENLFEPMPG